MGWASILFGNNRKSKVNVKLCLNFVIERSLARPLNTDSLFTIYTGSGLGVNQTSNTLLVHVVNM